MSSVILVNRIILNSLSSHIQCQQIQTFNADNVTAHVMKYIFYSLIAAITSMAEFSLVDQGSLLFETASGCILHGDQASGKVKFLPLGRWKGTMTIEDLPVKYIGPCVLRAPAEQLRWPLF